MAVLYRAMWHDDREGLVPAATEAFRSWVLRKSDGALQVTDGATSVGTTPVRSRRRDGSWDSTRQPAETALHHAGDGGGQVRRAVRASLVESRDDGSRWTTTLRAWSCAEPDAPEVGGGAGWLWVDVEAVTSESFDGTVIAAPGLVRDLVGSGLRPRRRCVPLQEVATRYEGEEGAEELAGLLSHTDRDLPIVVFSDDPVRTRPSGGPALFDTIVGRVAARSLGIAAVAVLDPAGSTALGTILGEHHTVWGGAFRMYLPGVDPATGRDEWRHRYVLPDRYLRHVDTAARVVARALAPAAAARRAPASYAVAKPLLDAARHADAGELAEWLAMAEEDAARQRSKQADLAARYEDLLLESQDVLENRALLASELDDALRRLRHAESLLSERDRGLYRLSQPGVSAVPVTAATPTDAALQAQEHLSDHLDLPDAACVELDLLDSAQEAGPWGQTSWDALRALHAYAGALAAGDDPGSFWVWCKQSRHPLAWRATSKKLAMVESGSLMDRDKFARKRVLPVSTDVDPSGEMLMESHMKVAEGGGNLAPRIYFTVSRKTGKAHVGYFGPHKNMPNSKM